MAFSDAYEWTSYGGIGEYKMDKEIFISHRSCDKSFADLLETFLTTCGIPTEKIFCSSLPGNDILCEISKEIKAALKTSKLNMVLLSNSYYQSAYCQNEAGVIWYSETGKVIFALPEINDHNMEGFLNSENKLHSMDNKSDWLAVSDILRTLFPGFITTAAGLNSKIDKSIAQYTNALNTRASSVILTKANTDNTLEREIQIGSFSDAEKVILLFFYETQKLLVAANLLPIKDWLIKQNALDIDLETGIELLAADDLVEQTADAAGNVNQYKIKISTYRKLRKITQSSIDILRAAVQIRVDEKHEKGESEIDNLIEKGFSTEEVLLIKYILDVSRETLYAGWLAPKETSMIRNWEEINALDDTLSKKYQDLLNKLYICKFIEVKQFTEHGNPKEYRISPAFLQALQSISRISKDTIQRIVDEHKATPDDLPF